jgi:putative Mg2+ transporter-C (MgtC) family protein
MSGWWDAVAGDFAAELADGSQFGRAAVRLLLAAALGAALGLEREYAGKSAGLRTHILITLGSAFFVLIPTLAGMGAAEISRVIQGLLAGIGLLGGGVILKHSDQDHVRGLTTAAGLWLAAGIGVAAGLGRLILAMGVTAAALLVLVALPPLERYDPKRGKEAAQEDPHRDRHTV